MPTSSGDCSTSQSEPTGLYPDLHLGLPPCSRLFTAFTQNFSPPQSPKPFSRASQPTISSLHTWPSAARRHRHPDSRAGIAAAILEAGAAGAGPRVTGRGLRGEPPRRGAQGLSSAGMVGLASGRGQQGARPFGNQRRGSSPLGRPLAGFDSPILNSASESCPTLCDRIDCSMPGFPVLHQPPELAQTHVHRVRDAIQPSHPLFSPSPAFNLSQHQGFFK